MSFSDYLENKLLDHIFKVAAFAQPTNIYVALSTADPTDDGSGLAEPSGGNYARVLHNTWTTASGGSLSNNGAITFNTATAAWGTITHVAIFDASTGGNMLCHGALDTSKAVNNGDTAEFADGDLTISLD